MNATQTKRERNLLAQRKFRAKPGYKEYDRNRARKRRSNPVHRSSHNAQAKDWYWKNRDRVRAQQKAYRQENPHVVRLGSQRRHARKMAANIDDGQIAEWVERVRYLESVICYYCRNSIPVSFIHFDHVIALARGGSHSIGNLAISCASCNLSKQDRLPSEWVKSGQLLLDL